MPDPVLVGVVGVTAAELVERSPHSNGSSPLSAAELERWLLEAGLAEPNGAPGRLVPTGRAIDIVRSLTRLSTPMSTGRSDTHNVAMLRYRRQP